MPAFEGLGPGAVLGRFTDVHTCMVGILSQGCPMACPGASPGAKWEFLENGVHVMMMVSAAVSACEPTTYRLKLLVDPSLHARLRALLLLLYWNIKSKPLHRRWRAHQHQTTSAEHEQRAEHVRSNQDFRCIEHAIRDRVQRNW